MGEATAPAVQKFYTVGDKDEFDPEKWTSSTPNELPKRDPETHVKVLIVRAGFAGLMTALECCRKGHNVVGILERNDGPNYSGHLLIIQPSAIAVFRHWPDMLRELEEDKVTAPTYYYRHTSDLIYGPSEPSYNDPGHLAERENFPYAGPVQIRKKFYTILLRQAAKIGIKVDYGQRVDQYFEDEQASMDGVVMADGSVRVADIVVTADAFKSRSELLIAGKHIPTQSSGMSVYRVSFPAHLTMQDEEVRKR
ncbi:Monooxygenase FAD-binding [Penicillium expansum]|nr:Monooxygenase FAD-binding [Penicillium expansum]